MAEWGAQQDAVAQPFAIVVTTGLWPPKTVPGQILAAKTGTIHICIVMPGQLSQSAKAWVSSWMLAYLALSLLIMCLN